MDVVAEYLNGTPEDGVYMDTQECLTDEDQIYEFCDLSKALMNVNRHQSNGLQTLNHF